MTKSLRDHDPMLSREFDNLLFSIWSFPHLEGMDNYHLPPGGTSNVYSPTSIWNLESQELCTPERKQTLYTYRDNDDLNLYYMNKVMHWFWDPSSLSETTNSPPIQTERQSVKRDYNSMELGEELHKLMIMRYDIYDALRQTEVPNVPTASNLAPTVTQNQSTPSERPTIPTVNYFSNEILFYCDGVFRRPEHIINPSFHFYNSQWIPELLSESEEDESEVESVYSLEDDVECKEKEDVHSQLLYSLLFLFMYRKDYACPICFESPTSPVSTICGHVFCEKCLKRLFRVGSKCISDG